MLKKILNAIKKNYKIIIILICLIIFLSIVQDIFKKETTNIDIVVYKLVVENMRNDVLTNIFKVVTNLGGAYALLGITIILLIFLKNKKISLSILINLVIVSVLNILIKNVIDRPRPIGYRLIDETGYSFPSGHSMISAAFYGLIIYFLWKNVKNKTLKYVSCIVLSLIIFLIGISRIYLGVHYATDVIGGFLVSIVYLVAFATVCENIIK